MKWEIKYQSEINHIQVLGVVAESEDECRQYFARRVSDKIAESNGAEGLLHHLSKLEMTGFDLRELTLQANSLPRAKDWEIGEAFAEIALEDEYGTKFPWPTGLDKRTSKASLPGPDLIGIQQSGNTRFVFGEVKSTSQNLVPPRVVASGEGCLRNQMNHLRNNPESRLQLIKWLYLRIHTDTFNDTFDKALSNYFNYSDNEMWLVGVLISGSREPAELDLSTICDGIDHQPGKTEVHLLGYYLPFHKDEWVDIIYGKEITP